MISQSDAQEADTTPPVVNVPADIVVESPDGTAQEITFVAKTSTVLKLDSLAPIPTSGQSWRTVDIFGQLLTIDRQSTISGAEIKLVFTGFTYAGKDHYKITTDNNGKFDWSNIIPIEEGYAIQAVYDGSSNFKSSKSQTEYFDVRSAPLQPQPPSPPPLQITNWGAMLFWIVIIMVVVIVVVRKLKKRKKRSIQYQTTGVSGQQQVYQQAPPKPKAKWRRKSKTPKPQGIEDYDLGPLLYCPNVACRSEHLQTKANGQKYCTKCGWNK